MDRRTFLSTGLVGLGALYGIACPVSALAAVKKKPLPTKIALAPSDFDLSKGTRSVDWLRPATGERLTLTYMKEGLWLPGAYDKMCHLLRDVQANEAVQMDAALIAILDWTQAYLRQHGRTEPMHILSGYRTKRTNNKLENAARNSQHLFGKAVDFRLPGVSADHLGKVFRKLAQGGVGVYRQSNFVHVDTGRVRSWRG